MMPKAISLKERVALLGGFALFLAAIEFLIPKPLPFLRLGISNLALLLGLLVLDFKHFLLLLGVKAILQAVLQGTLFSYVFLLSLGGSLASGLVMFLSLRLFGSRFSLAGISLLGALASNLVQLWLAAFFFLGKGVFLVAPPFILVGIISSFLLGLFANRFARQSKWLKTNQFF